MLAVPLELYTPSKIFMRENAVKEKSYRFAVEIMRLSKSLVLKKEFVLSRQVLRSGTSIGANIRESQYAQSKADFIHKLSIALKEANETDYWLSLLFEGNFIEGADFMHTKSMLLELIRLLTKIINTTKANNY